MFQSPQWGSNSKALAELNLIIGSASFSPRNGEVILKAVQFSTLLNNFGFSPRNGEVILKVLDFPFPVVNTSFQSPQWGSNSKGVVAVKISLSSSVVSVPAMGK